ncbi:MAG: CoB--CoM heterodisulfide reductase iron-sulfur subunit A family protein, partial [Deltaproteobacteria bacterium]
DYYRKAAELGVKFIRWEPEEPPKLEAEGSEAGKLKLTVADPVLDQRLELEPDYVVLSAAVVPSSGVQELSRLFKTPLSPDGFFQEAHVKLRPVDFAAEGVFLCGTAHYPKHVKEVVAQALGAAGRAASLLAQDSITASGSVCVVKEKDCVACGACINACTYGAIEFRETAAGLKAHVNPILCKGDGLCNAKCPTNAIELKHFTNRIIFNQIDAALPRAEEPADSRPARAAGS